MLCHSPAFNLNFVANSLNHAFNLLRSRKQLLARAILDAEIQLADLKAQAARNEAALAELEYINR